MNQSRIYIIHLGECDIRRCTAIKLRHFNLVNFIGKYDRRTQGAIFLDPFAEKALSKEDRETIKKKGLVALDGSWKKIERNKFLIFYKRYASRALPYLIAGNPTHYGTPTKLSTVEALAFALFITGFKEQTFDLLRIFSWGINSFKLNQYLLEMYSKLNTAQEVVNFQNEFLEEQRRKG